MRKVMSIYSLNATRAVLRNVKVINKCQICGNTYLSLNQNSKSCEFCKTPFHNRLSSVQATSMMGMSA